MIDERRPEHDDIVIERLIRLAGTDPEIPENGARRVREAVRPTWQREVRARVLRRRAVAVLGTAAAVLAIAAVVLVARIDRAPGGAGPVAVVELVRGTVTISEPGNPDRTISAGQAGFELMRGAAVRTGASSRVALRLEGARSLRLDHETAVRLDEALVVALEHGGLYVDSGARFGNGVQVTTTVGSVREIGTRFEVRMAANTLQVRVRSGEVEVSRGSSRFDVTRGEALWMSSEGEPTRHSVATWSPEWRWVQQVAPPFEIEGRTVAAYLSWVAAETGLRVEYASSDAERFAADTVLHGTVVDIAPAQTIDAVLASCGLVAERTHNMLTVSRGSQHFDGWSKNPGVNG